MIGVQTCALSIFGPDLRKLIGAPAHVENDATAAAHGEWQAGAAKGARDALLVALGTGIGGGIVMGGVLQRGANGFREEGFDPKGAADPLGMFRSRFRRAPEAGPVASILSLADADLGAWWTVVGPLTMIVMFLTASIPLAEARSAERRPGWAEYAARTPKLLPRLSRSVRPTIR